MLTNKPQAVIFDMDGLILDSEIGYRAAWQQAARELAYEMSDDRYACFVGRRTVDCHDLLVEIYGDSFPLDDFLAKGRHYYQEHVQCNGIPTKPGLHKLLDFLHDQAIPTAVATSTGRTNALRCLGDLASRFAPIVTGDQVTQGKPAPDIFLLAAKNLQLPPQHCLVLEDADAGVQAAHAAGIPVIMVPDLKPPSAQSITQVAGVCSSLDEVHYMLVTLCGG